ncbi:MAG: helix-turn-helix domain-containing protein [Lepagella sp.]
MNGSILASDSSRTLGLVLCVAGWRDVMIGGLFYHIHPGVLCIKSPVAPLCEMTRSDDYEEVSIEDSPEVLMHVLRTNFDTFARIQVWKHPCLILDESRQELFHDYRRRIREKNLALADARSDEEGALIKNLIRLITQAAILEFAHLYFLDSVISPEKMNRDMMVVANFLLSLNRDFSHSRKVDDYAADAGLSTGHFSRVIKSVTGKSPSRWIIDLTIAKAISLLKQEDLRIKQVAQELGFPEQFTFSKFFIKHTGTSPKEFRLRRSLASPPLLG